MSVKATSWVWQESKSEGADRLVLLALADFADEVGRCFGSWGTLESKTRLSRSTIVRSLKRLEALGELARVEESRVVGSRNLATVWQLPVKGVSERDRYHCDTPPGVIVTPPRCQDDTPTCINTHETLSIEPTPSAPPTLAQPPQLTVIKESNSLPSLDSEVRLVRKREDVLGKGLTDEQWLRWLGEKNPNIDIPGLFDRCLAWCKDKSKVASRRQFMAFVRNAQKDVPMAVVRRPSAPAGQSAFERELAEIRMAVGA